MLIIVWWINNILIKKGDTFIRAKGSNLDLGVYPFWIVWCSSRLKYTYMIRVQAKKYFEWFF